MTTAWRGTKLIYSSNIIFEQVRSFPKVQKVYVLKDSDDDDDGGRNAAPEAGSEKCSDEWFLSVPERRLWRRRRRRRRRLNKMLLKPVPKNFRRGLKRKRTTSSFELIIVLFIFLVAPARCTAALWSGVERFLREFNLISTIKRAPEVLPGIFESGGAGLSQASLGTGAIGRVAEEGGRRLSWTLVQNLFCAPSLLLSTLEFVSCWSPMSGNYYERRAFDGWRALGWKIRKLYLGTRTSGLQHRAGLFAESFAVSWKLRIDFQGVTSYIHCKRVI